MKLALFTENNRCGGLDTFIINLINHWPSDDDLYLVCNKSHPGLKVIRNNLVKKCTFIPHEIRLNWELASKFRTYRLPALFVRLIFLALNPIYFLWLVFRLYNFFRKKTFDNLIVINGGYPAGMSCRTATIAWSLIHPGNRAIHNFHNFALRYRPHDFFYEWLYDYWVARSAKAFITVSDSCAQSLAVRKPIYKLKQPNFIYNGLGQCLVDAQDHMSIRQELGICENEHLCLMLGSYEPRKGHEFIFRVFDHVSTSLPNTHLIICGHGSDEEIRKVRGLKEKIAPNSHIYLLGFRADAMSLIAQSDLVVVPSQAYESFGYMALEAMSQKIPVVSTNVGGLPEVVKDGETGFIVDRGDEELFAEKVILLLQDQSMRNKFSRNGYIRYKELFTADKMARSYRDAVLKK